MNAAHTDSSGAYHFLRYRPDRVDFWIMEGLTLGGDQRIGKGLIEGDLADGVRYMPWGDEPALRNYAVPVLKLELADALLEAGVSAGEAASEVNAAIGPPNLALMGWGGTHTAGGRRTAKDWWNKYQAGA